MFQGGGKTKILGQETAPLIKQNKKQENKTKCPGGQRSWRRANARIIRVESKEVIEGPRSSLRLEAHLFYELWPLLFGKREALYGVEHRSDMLSRRL